MVKRWNDRKSGKKKERDKMAVIAKPENALMFSEQKGGRAVLLYPAIWVRPGKKYVGLDLLYQLAIHEYCKGDLVSAFWLSVRPMAIAGWSLFGWLICGSS